MALIMNPRILSLGMLGNHTSSSTSSPTDPYYSSELNQAGASPQPTEVDKLLQAVMNSFQEQPESGVAQPPPAPFNPMAGGWRGALNAVAAPYNQYQAPLIAPTLQYQQLQALQYPQQAAAARVKTQEIRQQNLIRALNTASLLEQRKAMAARQQATPAQMQPNRGNVRVYPQVDDSNSPTGVSTVTTQLVLQPDGSIKEVEIDRKPYSVSMSYKPGSLGGEAPQQYQINPHTGKMEPTGLYLPPTQGAEANYRKQMVNRQALGDIWNEYAKVHAYAQTKPDIANIRKMANTYASRNEYLRSLADPKYVDYTRTLDASLNAYILSVTGQQFAEAAFARYRNQYPMPWDTPEEARHALQALSNMVNRDIDIAVQRNPSFADPGAQNFPDPNSSPDNFDYQGFLQRGAQP